MNSTQIFGQELNYVCVGGGPKGPSEKSGQKPERNMPLNLRALCGPICEVTTFFFFLTE